MSSSVKLTYAKKWLLIVIFTPVLSVSFMSLIFNAGQEMAFAQGPAEQQEQGSPGGSPPEEIIVRRVEIWGVFYRLMVVAFVVGAVVQGTVIYVCWRFRESNKKNKPREHLEGMHR
jgi:nicotinamide riboside transporter PnuC